MFCRWAKAKGETMTNWIRYTIVTLGVGLLAAVIATQGAAPALAHGEDGPFDCDGQLCAAVVRGFLAFNDRHLNELGGNGRACADCHMPTDGFQLSPAAARERFEGLLARRTRNPRADDPLFRPVDADDFRENGADASVFSNLVENGLVRITMPLPANVRLIDSATGQPSDETFVDLWRAVMPVFNVAITGSDDVDPLWPDLPRVPIMGIDPDGPNTRGGYQHDARFGTLQEQAQGALVAHAQIDGVPSARLLDDLAAFQSTLFSSRGVRRLAEAIRSGQVLPDPDPELTPVQELGKGIFNRACATCHGGPHHPSTTTPDVTLPTVVAPVARYFNIRTSCPRPPEDTFAPCPQRLARNARTYQITLANGTTQRVTTTDPGRMLLTGQPADVGMMDVTNLRGIGATAPYFHNNSAATLEDVLDHYDAFFRRVARVNRPPRLPAILSSDGVTIDRGFVTAEERPALLAYLRVL
jgi:cytochrome c peroxidase